MHFVKERMTEVLLDGDDIPKGVVLDDLQRTTIVSMLRELKPNWLE